MVARSDQKSSKILTSCSTQLCKVHFGGSILESKILSKREKRSQKNVAYQMKHQIC